MKVILRDQYPNLDCKWDMTIAILIFKTSSSLYSWGIKKKTLQKKTGSSDEITKVGTNTYEDEDKLA